MCWCLIAKAAEKGGKRPLLKIQTLPCHRLLERLSQLFSFLPFVSVSFMVSRFLLPELLQLKANSSSPEPGLAWPCCKPFFTLVSDPDVLAVAPKGLRDFALPWESRALGRHSTRRTVRPCSTPLPQGLGAEVWPHPRGRSQSALQVCSGGQSGSSLRQGLLPAAAASGQESRPAAKSAALCSVLLYRMLNFNIQNVFQNNGSANGHQDSTLER